MMTFKRKKFGTLPTAKEREARRLLDEKLAQAYHIRGAMKGDSDAMTDYDRETTEELR